MTLENLPPHVHQWRSKLRPAGPEEEIQLRLGLAPEAAPWISAGPETAVRMGDVMVPARRFKKELIRIGTYVKDEAGLIFHVTADALGNWVVQFSRMMENGVKVPIPATHQDAAWEKRAQTGDPRDNMGWVDGLWIEGKTLWMSCNLHGTDALIASKRADVSIFSPAHFVDGEGHSYSRPITHVAMVTDPVVPGLGEFIALSQSVRLQERPIMLEFLQKLGALLGLDPAQFVDEATGMELIVQALTALLERVSTTGEGEAGVGGVPGAGAASAGTGQVRKEVVTREFSANKKPEPPNPMYAKMLGENRGLKLSRLVESGKITPAQKQKLEEVWCSEAAMTLALSSGSDGKDFDQIIEVLEMQELAIKPGEKTRQQTVSASLTDPKKGGKPEVSPLLANARVRREKFDKTAALSRR